MEGPGTTVTETQGVNKMEILQAKAIIIPRHHGKETDPPENNYIQGGDKNKYKTMKIASAISSVIASDAE